MIDPVDRILIVLSHFILIKREVEWLRRHEPDEYDRLKIELRKELVDDDTSSTTKRTRSGGSPHG